MAMKLRVWILMAVCGCPIASAAPPELLSVDPTISREAWLARFQNPDAPRARTEVSRYEKFELQIDVRAEFDNPYDPDDIDVSAEFTSPSGKVWSAWGFYNPGFGSQWMVRFTPTETGQWTYKVKVRDREGVAESDPEEFTCVFSRHRGFIGMAPNRRYLRYSDGSSFYGVGLWYNDGFRGGGRGFITEDALDDLRRLGVNFISFFPTPLETHGTGLGRYDAARSARLDEVVGWCEERDIHISWNLVFHSHISEAVWGGSNALYRDNPYRTIAPARDFFRSDDAWKYQQKLYRYVLARWGYSRAVFLWFVIDEINGCEGWTEGGHESAEAWCRQMNDLFHEHDPYGRPTTGTQSGGVDQWWPEGYRIFDVAGREIYEAQGHPMPAGGKPDLMGDHPLRASYRNYARQTRDLWNGFEKPAIIAETGYDHTYYEPGMPGYLATYHNALWASLANGACATPFWWSYSPYINETVLTSHVRAFANFVRDIDFANRQWAPAEIEVSAGDGWAMRSGGEVFGWMANPSGGAAKETFTVSGLPDGAYEARIYRTWRGAYLPPISVNAADGKLSVTIPELTHDEGSAQHIGDDVAFKIESEDLTRAAGRRRDSRRSGQ
jgi:hypothetical protein